MCGILGSLSTSLEKPQFEKALSLMETRGPDAEGLWYEGNLFFGHRRLSIIDTSEDANQPFQIEGLVVIFNGEIYNYQTLRNELIALGCTFRTTSDTEVLLQSYRTWGTSCTEKLDGMWAFVIYDKTKNTLFFSRDRIGEKPMLYSITQDGIIFGSEMRSILALLEGETGGVNLEAISQFGIYNFRHIPSPYTPFKNIEKLRPGYNMIYSIDEKKIIREEKYFSPKKVETGKDPIEKLDGLLQDAVKQTCYAEVPVGVLLSGGVDSSLIASLMKDRDIMTYSLGWDEHDEEIIRAKQIATHLGLKNTIIYYKDYLESVNLVDVIKRNIHHYGEPINLFQIIYSDIILKRMHEDGIRVAVGGNGADELFYGYDGMNLLYGMSTVKSITDTLHISKLFRLIPSLSFLGESLENTKPAIYQNTLEKTSFLQKTYRKFIYGDVLREYANELPKKSLIEVFSWLGLRVENEHSITIVGDIAGSLEGMEVRTPFLSKDILDFSASLPIRYKVRSMFSKKENKYILKKVLEKYLPKDLIYRKKMGFGYGIRYDTFVEKYKKEFSFYFSDILTKIPIYEHEVLQKMLEENKKEDTNTLINILIVCIWWEQNIL